MEDWKALASIAIPTLFGLVLWVMQALNKVAWEQYNRRQELYREVIRQIDCLFDGNYPNNDVAGFLKSVREMWLVAPDEVVRSLNSLLAAIKSADEQVLDRLYGELVFRMRADLNKRRWFPPNSTELSAGEFKVEGAKRI